jgi:hypothetical protein
VWDLAQRLGGQLRVIPGAVIGWDMGAALAPDAALGISPIAIAELLPALEAVMVRKLNEQMNLSTRDRIKDPARSGVFVELHPDRKMSPKPCLAAMPLDRNPKALALLSSAHPESRG